MTMDELSAKFVRVERQDAPGCGTVSFERHAARAFQAYVAGVTRFGVPRAGLLYGTVDDDSKDVSVEAIYEPPQDATRDAVTLTRGGDDEALADFVAGRLGLRKVGWVLAQAAGPRDYILSDAELRQAASIQAELGETAVTGVVSVAPSGEGGSGGDVHFEAFQVSRQAADLAARGWLAAPASGSPAGVTRIVNPDDPGLACPAVVAGKDASEVDNDWFLVPVAIRDHGGPLAADFPIENRLTAQGAADLAAHLASAKRKPPEVRHADFHLLLWLARHPGLDPADVGALAEAVAAGEAVGEGYELILEGLAAAG
jgi:nuclear protein localization family protein 4